MFCPRELNWLASNRSPSSPRPLCAVVAVVASPAAPYVPAVDASRRGAMFYTLLRALPGGENFKVIVGVVAICGVGTAGLLHKKGRGYDSMADKRAAQQAEIDAAQKEAQVKAPVSSLLVGREK